MPCIGESSDTCTPWDTIRRRQKKRSETDGTATSIPKARHSYHLRHIFRPWCAMPSPRSWSTWSGNRPSQTMCWKPYIEERGSTILLCHGATSAQSLKTSHCRDLLIRMEVQKLRLKFVHGCILKMFLQLPLATSQRRGRPFLIFTPSLEADSTKPASPCRILFLVRYLMLFLPVGVLRTRTRRYSNWPPNHHISL